MNKLYTFIFVCLGLQTNTFSQQCEINASAFPTQIYCGQSTTLTANGIGAGTVVLSEDFNSGGYGSGWSGTPGSTNFSNPCSSGGVDGTPHAWMGSSTSVPRTLTSASFDLSGASAGVTICFDMLFARQCSSCNAPCEGPDEPDEGVYLEYSTDNGATWHQIHYFNPNGGNDAQLINWNNWCFQIPAGALTSNTRFRWHQTADSGADYDHWGIDNVQIVQNDILAEIVWGNPGDDYYYSYGVGSSGGQHPNPVSPTTTTTYNVQITTGTGQVCTTDVTVTVLDPVYEVTLNTDPDPATVCNGECVEVTGTAIQVIHPGGITKYENNQTENVSGAGIGSVSASVNVNVQGLNVNALLSGMITEVCINQFNYFASGFPSNTTVANFEYKLVAPGGCGEIILIPQGTLQPSTNTGSMQNVCFVVGGATNIGSVSQPYTGSYQPNQPFDNLVGCDPNGVWTLQMTASTFLSIGIGAFTGWSITFNNPPVYGAVSTSWSPATGVSVPTTGLSNPNNINTEICPPNTGNYVLTVGNGIAGCATRDFPLAITVDQCNGCVVPAFSVDALTECEPNTVDLADAVTVSPSTPVPGTFSYHSSQTDAENDVNPLSNTTISSSGTYWVRGEHDDTCFVVQSITVTIADQDDASFSLTNFCAGSTNSASNIATPGGTFAFNPAPGDGATINTTTGAISNGVGGTTYTVQYTTGGTCPASSTEQVQVYANPAPVISGNLTYCPGNSSLLDAGAGYVSYLWNNPSASTSQTITTTAITGLTVTVTDANGCSGTSPAVNISESSLITNNSTVFICPGETATVHGNPVSTAGVYEETFPTGSGCDSLSRVTVVIRTVVQPVISGDLWYCEGQTTTLSTTPGNYTSYSWSTGSTQATISTTTDQPITVTVVDANGCSSTSNPVVLVHPPQAVVNANPTSGTAPLTVDFENNSTGATSYDWYFIGVDTFSTVNLNDIYTYVYDSLGTYTVVLVAHSANCSDTAIAYIVVEDPAKPLDAHIPNVFTPNGDGVNDFFTFDTSNAADLKLTIVNRWGNLIYESTDVNFMWDGKDMSGNPVTEGVYFFDYRIIGLLGEELSGHGFVTVER